MVRRKSDILDILGLKPGRTKLKGKLQRNQLAWIGLAMIVLSAYLIFVKKNALGGIIALSIGVGMILWGAN